VQLIRQRYYTSTSDRKVSPSELQLMLAALDVKFRRAVGCTISQYLRNVRMNAAARLLANHQQHRERSL
jgi:AraC-like DNA-binding protein